MSQFVSPLKLCPSNPKKVGMKLNGTNELLIKMRNVSKNRFMEARRDGVLE